MSSYSSSLFRILVPLLSLCLHYRRLRPKDNLSGTLLSVFVRPVDIPVLATPESISILLVFVLACVGSNGIRSCRNMHLSPRQQPASDRKYRHGLLARFSICFRRRSSRLSFLPFGKIRSLSVQGTVVDSAFWVIVISDAVAWSALCFSHFRFFLVFSDTSNHWLGMNRNHFG